MPNFFTVDNGFGSFMALDPESTRFGPQLLANVVEHRFLTQPYIIAGVELTVTLKLKFCIFLLDLLKFLCPPTRASSNQTAPRGGLILYTF